MPVGRKTSIINHPSCQARLDASAPRCGGEPLSQGGCFALMAHGASVPSTVQAGRQAFRSVEPVSRVRNLVSTRRESASAAWCSFCHGVFKVLLSQGFQTAWQDFAAEAAGLGWPLTLCSMRCHHSSHPLQLISGGPYHHSLCVVSTVVSILCSTSYMSTTACQRPSFWGLVLPGRGRMPWRWRQRRHGKEQLLRPLSKVPITQ